MGPESKGKACKKFIDKTGKSSREKGKCRKVLNLNKSIHCGEASEQAYESIARAGSELRAYGGCLGSWRRRRTW